MSLIDKYKELNKELDILFMEQFGRTDRNNIDIKNLNPPVLLQTIALINLTEKIEALTSRLDMFEQAHVELDIEDIESKLDAKDIKTKPANNKKSSSKK